MTHAEDIEREARPLDVHPVEHLVDALVGLEHLTLLQRARGPGEVRLGLNLGLVLVLRRLVDVHACGVGDHKSSQLGELMIPRLRTSASRA